MNEQSSVNDFDNLLFQFAVQTRELSQRKYEIDKQVTGLRDDIAERKSHIERMRIKIKTLEDEIQTKQKTLIHIHANAKRMTLRSDLLCHYEQILKKELERRETSYNDEKNLYEERLASYRKTFESHREVYCQNPLAQKLLTLQAEKEEIESRIKACDDEITVKQKELDHLTAKDSSTTEDLQQSVSDQEPTDEPVKGSNVDTEEECHSSTVVAFPHLSQTTISQDAHTTQEKVNEDDLGQEKMNLSSSEEVTHLEQPSHLEDIEEEETEEDKAAVEVQPESEQHNAPQSVCPQLSSPGSNPQASPATVTLFSTPTFPFGFSPRGSPLSQSPASTSTGFPFSLNSEPGTSAFPGFGFDENASQDGASSFAFAGSFLKEKETTETKSLSCPFFLFGQQEEGEDFQFAFSSKSPQATKDNSQADFQFPFNF